MDNCGDCYGSLSIVLTILLTTNNFQEQKEFVEKLSHDFESFTGEMHDFVGQTNTTMTTLEDSCKNTEFIVKELKDYVDHFGDNLFLSSNQITVETTTGFSQKPVNLTDILKQCNTQFIDGEAKAVEHDEKINTLSEELATKAPETILFNVATLEKKVGTIEIHLQKEEEQGIAVSIPFY